jgi:hypothetical protein
VKRLGRQRAAAGDVFASSSRVRPRAEGIEGALQPAGFV